MHKKKYLYSISISIAIWLFWYIIQIYARTSIGLEDINENLLRIAENYTSPVLIKEIGIYILAQFLFLSIMAWIIYATSIGITELLKIKKLAANFLAAAILIILIQTLNSAIYPISATAFPITINQANLIILTSFIVLLIFFLIACLRHQKILWQAIIFTFACSTFYWFPQSAHVTQETSLISEAKPNIIIIGIDAVRPSDLKQFGSHRNVMPFLDSLLMESEVFQRNYTPAARTHAAWVATLSGRYPYHNGVRFNLTEDHYIDKQRLITHSLKEQGYYTVWGLDERRFNNIDESYGFDKIVGPKLGSAEFVITKLSDIPIINLISNTQIGKYLLPYIYINRGNYVTYNPYQFNDEIISSLKTEKPFFLAAHLCLPHYPFINNLMNSIVEEENLLGHYKNYLSMLELSDRQLANLFGKLKSEKHLENTIVYIISDHGEGFPGIDKELINGNNLSKFKTSDFGHGTNVLTLSQYHTLLARINFNGGRASSTFAKNNKLTSLIDIAPDIESRIKTTSKYLFDGEPLNKISPSRSIILESSFSNKAISSSRINQLAVLQQSADAYYVDDNGRLLLRGSLYKELSRAKQRALISNDDIMVALFPDEKESAFIVDIPKNTWWPSAAYIPEEINWQPYLKKLCDFYKDDITFEQEILCLKDK